MIEIKNVAVDVFLSCHVFQVRHLTNHFVITNASVKEIGPVFDERRPILDLGGVVDQYKPKKQRYLFG